MQRQRWYRFLFAVLAGGMLLQTSSSCRGQFLSTLSDTLTSSLTTALQSQITNVVQDALTNSSTS